MKRNAAIATAFASGLGAVMLLAAAWHTAGWASPTQQPGYPFTEYFTGCVGVGFVVALAVTMFVLGWLLRPAWAIGLGAMTPLPIAMVLEIIRDRTSHNLMPFEVVLYWAPTFWLSFGIAWLGSLAHRRMRGAHAASGA